MKIQSGKIYFKKILLLLFFFSLLFTSCKKDKTDAPVTDAVFIYKTNDADALAYKALLVAKNKTVNLVEWNAVSSYDFSNTKLIVIGSGSSFLWTDTLQPSAAKLRQQTKPFLYMGNMGSMMAFYNKKIVNHQSSASQPAEDVKALNVADNIFTTPNNITIPPSGNLTLATVGTGSYVVFYAFPTLPAGVVAYGQSTSAPEYYPITMENSSNGTFGWNGSIANLTTSGKNLLVNMSFKVGGL